MFTIDRQYAHDWPKVCSRLTDSVLKIDRRKCHTERKLFIFSRIRVTEFFVRCNPDLRSLCKWTVNEGDHLGLLHHFPNVDDALNQYGVHQLVMNIDGALNQYEVHQLVMKVWSKVILTLQKRMVYGVALGTSALSNRMPQATLTSWIPLRGVHFSGNVQNKIIGNINPLLYTNCVCYIDNDNKIGLESISRSPADLVKTFQ